MAKESIPQASLFEQVSVPIVLHHLAIDMTGLSYGRLTALYPVRLPDKKGIFWECQCACGGRTQAMASHLRTGLKKSCGCLHRTISHGTVRSTQCDLTGRRFGRWLVLERAGRQGKHTTWKCQCDCGTIRDVVGAYLRHGTQSCGCLKKEQTALIHKGRPSPARLPEGVSAGRQLLGRYKYTAKQRNVEWCLTDEQAMALFRSVCFYCGAPPSQISPSLKKVWIHGQFIYNGIDRRDNGLGYTIENTLACCKQCNYAKRHIAAEEFYDWIRRAYHHLLIQRVFSD